MAWVYLVTILALAEFFVFSLLVGKARGTYKVPAPATSGDPMFERYFRVHQNTLELLVIFVPVLWIAGQYWPEAAALVGLIFPIGRLLYLRLYLNDPSKRTPGFALSILPIVVLTIMGLVGIIGRLLG